MSKQLALIDISAATKISTKFLEAIESEDFASLPGLIFTRSFVRQYASFMEIDAEPLLALLPRFDLEAAPLPQPPDRPRKPFFGPGWSSALASIMWTALAVAGAIGAWAYMNRPSPLHNDTVQAATQQQPETPVVEPARETAPESNPEPPSENAADNPVQVVLAAKEEAWILATADGKKVFNGMMKPGESRNIEAHELVRLRTGNAGGIEISLNGKALDPIGPSGQIRTVTLTAAGPQIPPDSPTTPVVSSPF